MSSEAANLDRSEKHRRSWKRWLMLSTAVLVALVVFCGGVLVWMVWRQWDRRQAAITFRERGVSSFGFDPTVSMWFFNWVDERYPDWVPLVGSALQISIYGSEVSDADLALLQHFPELR